MDLYIVKHLSIEALENVRSAIVISDATDPDHRIIYTNRAFQTLTGFGPDEVLGRNCRFLQGTDRNQESRKTIAEALRNEQPVRAVLRNYRKDGSLFHNELFIDPILNSKSSVTHFVACQNAVPDPNLAGLRQTATLRLGRLTEREREVLSLVASGYPNKMVARELGISARTAEKHRINVLKKFEVSELTLLVRYAIAMGMPLMEPPDTRLEDTTAHG